jgi:RHS repeat-associated protein
LTREARSGWSFDYAANGNMTSGRGTSLDWTSYNYPSCIRLGSSCSGTSADYSSFSYTPDRQYWKQQSNYVSGGQATTIYVGGLLEKVTTASGTDYRHMIRAGSSTIIVSRQSSGTNSVYYVTSDHLGSSSAITNGSGGILVNSSFGPFGARRGANWTGSPSAGDWTAIAGTTRRGFTEHSMLDNLNLTHMNGRVYDQMLGRFVSADPYITEPFNTQNYNRYSYVLNNPLSVLDPTGFWQVGIGWPGEIRWNNPCAGADTRTCWSPFPGHFDDNVYSHFISDSRNARHGEIEPDTSPGPSDPKPSSEAGWLPTAKSVDPFAGAFNSVNWAEVRRIQDEQALRRAVTDPDYIATMGLVLSVFPGVMQLVEGSLVAAEQSILIQSSARLTAPVMQQGANVTGNAARSIGSTARVGERVLEGLGGESKAFFRTSQGSRFVDQLVNRIAHESKVGYTTLTKEISRQIAKDAELIATRQIDGATWHFFRSPITGLGTPSAPLREALEQARIGIVVH